MTARARKAAQAAIAPPKPSVTPAGKSATPKSQPKQKLRQAAPNNGATRAAALPANGQGKAAGTPNPNVKAAGANPNAKAAGVNPNQAQKGQPQKGQPHKGQPQKGQPQKGQPQKGQTPAPKKKWIQRQKKARPGAAGNDQPQAKNATGAAPAQKKQPVAA